MAQCKAALPRTGMPGRLLRLLHSHDGVLKSAKETCFLRRAPLLKAIPSCNLQPLKEGITHPQCLYPAGFRHSNHHSYLFQDPLEGLRGLKTDQRGGTKPAQKVRAATAKSAPYATESEFRYFATCTPGLEKIVAEELASPSIDAKNVVPAKAGVGFTGGLAVGYRANLWLRCAVRVLIHMAEGELVAWRPAGDEVYEFIRRAVDWRALLLVEGENRRGHFEPPQLRTFWVDTRVWDCTNVTHSGMVSVRAKDAICDAIRDSCQGAKPPAPENGAAGADVPLFLTLYRDKATLYRDMSGVSLHKRGYRDAMHRASLNEGVAAGMLRLAGFGSGGFQAKNEPETTDAAASSDAPLRERDESGAEASGGRDRALMSLAGSMTSARRPGPIGGDEGRARSQEGAGPSGRGAADVAKGGADVAQVLLDPMCGSGTLLIEAALMAVNKAPGLLRRRWPFESWPDFDERLWRQCVRSAEASETDWPHGLRLLGNDIHPGALALCRRDAAAAGVLDLLTLSQEDVADYAPPAKPTHVVVNPPWGLRLETLEREAQEEEHYMLASAYQKLGAFLKDQCTGADVFLLSGNADATRNMRLRADRKWPLSVGGIDCRVLHYKVLPPLSEAGIRAIAEEKEARRRTPQEGVSKSARKEEGVRYGVREGRPLQEIGRGRRSDGGRGGVKFDWRDDVDSERVERPREQSERGRERKTSVW